jgi:hypothetical protein
MSPQDEIEALDRVLTAVNERLTELAERLEKTSKWPEGQNALDRVFLSQDTFLRHSDAIRTRLKELGF